MRQSAIEFMFGLATGADGAGRLGRVSDIQSDVRGLTAKGRLGLSASGGAGTGGDGQDEKDPAMRRRKAVQLTLPR